jgi:hypothetical protein
MQHPTGTSPKRVALIGAGPSMSEWTALMSAAEMKGPRVDEVWGINTVGRAVACDMTFAMDDYAAMRGHIQYHAEWYEKADHPVITSVVRPNCPKAVAYPLAEVLALPHARGDFLNHTAAYAAAYAVLIGVKELIVFGCDYVADNYRAGSRGSTAARYLGCMSYWCGYAAARGTEIIVCPSSPLLDADKDWDEKLYGYVIKPVIRREEAPATDARPEPKAVPAVAPKAVHGV